MDIACLVGIWVYAEKDFEKHKTLTESPHGPMDFLTGYIVKQTRIWGIQGDPISWN